MSSHNHSQRCCVVLGGGGHCRVLLDCMQASGACKIVGILDADRSRWGLSVQRIPILGGDDLLPALKKKGVHFWGGGWGGGGDNAPRQRLFALGQRYHMQPLTVIHPSAICSKWATIADGAQLLPGCIVNAGATIGANVIVNSGAIVEHDCRIEDHSHIAPGARLGANVHVRIGAHIGLGACVRQGIVIGPRAIVGAGAMVVKDVAAHTVVVGVPARGLCRGPASEPESRQRPKKGKS